MELITSIFGDIKSYGLWYPFVLLLVYPSIRKKIPKGFVRDFVDGFYLSFEKLYWALKLFFVHYNKIYLKELNKFINVSACSHIQGLNFHEFTPASKYFVQRYYKPYVHHEDTSTGNFIATPKTKEEGAQGFSHAITKKESLSRDVNYVLGPAGYGKTSLAKRICIDLINKSISAPIILHCSDKSIQRAISELSANDHVGTTQALLGQTCEFSVLATKYWRGKKIHVSPQFFQKKLREGCYVIIDGFDDIPTVSDRKFFSSWLEQYNVYYEKCNFIVFSRKYAFNELKADNSRGFMLEGFNLSQIEKFTESFYTAAISHNRPCYKKTTSEDFKREFIRRVGSDSILIRMASNPLLLTFMLDLHFTGNKLPENKTKLCEKILQDSLAWKRPNLDTTQSLIIMTILSELAFFTHSKPQNREFEMKHMNSLAISAGFENLDELGQHLLNNSAIVEVIDWQRGFIKFVNDSFGEFCVAWNLCKNSDFGFIAQYCGDEKFREILQFFVHQAKDLSPLFNSIESRLSHLEKDTDVLSDLIKAKFYILTIIKDNFENKLSPKIYKKLTYERDKGFTENIRLYVGVNIHLRLTKLLISDPIDINPIYCKEANYLALEYDKNNLDPEKALVGLNKRGIDSLLDKLNDFYGATRGTFDLPTKKILPEKFNADAIIRNGDRYEIFNMKHKQFKLIKNSISESVLKDFCILSDAIRKYSDATRRNTEVSDFVNELMQLWTPYFLFSVEDNELKLYNMHLFKKYLSIYISSASITGVHPTGSSVIDIAFNCAGAKQENPMTSILKTMYLFSTDRHSSSACNNFMKTSFSYLHTKTCEMVKDGSIESWGRIYLAYNSPFFNKLSQNEPLSTEQNRNKIIKGAE